MALDHPGDSLIKAFWNVVGPIKLQVIDPDTGEKKEEIMSAIPSALLLKAPEGRFRRKLYIPRKPEEVGTYAHDGFRSPKPFKQSLPDPMVLLRETLQNLSDGA